MGNANLTEEELQMRYPPSVLNWEMKHGIARYERNGMLYVCAARPLEEINASIEREKQAQMRRQNRGEHIESTNYSERATDHEEE